MRHALLVALAGITVLAACSKTVPAPDPVRAVRTQTVAPQTAGGAYEYAGEVKARTESRLSFRVAGKMLKRAVDLGDSVKAGQMLAELDPRDLRLGQDAARASVAMAQASYDQNAADFKRYKDLHDQGFIGPAELERRDMALKTARAQLDQAKAQSNVQGNQAGYAALLADAAGVITGVDVEPGMVVAAGAPVLRLAHDGPRDVVFSVPEDKVGLVKALAAQPGRFKVRLWGSAPEEPLGFVTTASLTLPAGSAGMLAVSVVALTTSTLVAGTPPMVSVAPSSKSIPLKVTLVPPAAGPDSLFALKTSCCENSDVLPAGSVAVAVTTSFGPMLSGRTRSKVPFPLASVVTTVEPM